MTDDDLGLIHLIHLSTLPSTSFIRWRSFIIEHNEHHDDHWYHHSSHLRTTSIIDDDQRSNTITMDREHLNHQHHQQHQQHQHQHPTINNQSPTSTSTSRSFIDYSFITLDHWRSFIHVHWWLTHTFSLNDSSLTTIIIIITIIDDHHWLGRWLITINPNMTSFIIHLIISGTSSSSSSTSSFIAHSSHRFINITMTMTHYSFLIHHHHHDHWSLLITDSFIWWHHW